ncbi:E3 ubiquitin-protein ligase ORTHRUS-LIKE 1 [Frankliniella fusca]|uniref:E3 ubiquitin-protein ligase ORTHRUS-LIKE 1 n=1 Tax=Frankliniella fusca TaxID=407009 RepID=A0AAE1LPT6_9NEOP|nr:E3 ubiquitin-protein ligase ORTHRUS-LIKE 1 [Frankliniella fusca]
MECYNTLFSGTGIHWKDEGNNIILCLRSTSPDWSANQPHWNLQRQGTLTLDVRFAAPLAQPINCIIYAEFQNLIEIDKK